MGSRDTHVTGQRGLGLRWVGPPQPRFERVLPFFSHKPFIGDMKLFFKQGCGLRQLVYIRAVPKTRRKLMIYANRAHAEREAKRLNAIDSEAFYYRYFWVVPAQSVDARWEIRES